MTGCFKCRHDSAQGSFDGSPRGAAAAWPDACSRIRPCLELLPCRSRLFDFSAAHGVRGRVQQLRTERPKVHRSIERGLRLGHPLRLASYTRRSLLACDHPAQRGGGTERCMRGGHGGKVPHSAVDAQAVRSLADGARNGAHRAVGAAELTNNPRVIGLLVRCAGKMTRDGFGVSQLLLAELQ